MFLSKMTLKERIKFGASAAVISIMAAGILVILAAAMYKEGHDAIAWEESSACEDE